MKIYILDQRKDNTKHNATGKAMTDVFEIMSECGVRTVPGVPKDAGKLLKVVDLAILAIYSIFVFSRNDYCVFVYKDNAVKIRMLKALKWIRHYKTICLINDVNGIRSGGYNSDDSGEKKKDFELIGTADIIMAPNEGSKKYMLERGMSNRIVTVGVWDYLMDDMMGEKCDDLAAERSVCHSKYRIGFAGNLGKSEFLNNIDEVMDDSYELHLWGDLNGRDIKNNSVIYEGSLSPSVLPVNISAACHFGLVWDGKSSTRIEGGYGEYLRFNNSHKCGCYLASGIPVIVWSGSGAAYFVNEMGCGITVNGLTELSERLTSMSDEEYDKIRMAARKVAKNIRGGYYLKRCLGEAVGTDFIEQ